MKKLFTLMLMGIFLLSLTSAGIQDLGTFAQGDSIRLIQICSDCTFNNITSIIDPNSQELIGIKPMTRTGSVYNFTLEATNTSEMGDYIVNGIGDDGGTDDIWNYKFTITADGQPFQAFPNQFVIIALAILLILVGLFNSRLRLLQHLGSIIMMVMGVITIYPGYNFINHTTLLGLSLGTILIGIGFYFLVEDSFSREGQQERFGQPQGREEEDFFDD